MTEQGKEPEAEEKPGTGPEQRMGTEAAEVEPEMMVSAMAGMTAETEAETAEPETVKKVTEKMPIVRQIPEMAAAWERTAVPVCLEVGQQTEA